VSEGARHQPAELFGSLLFEDGLTGVAAFAAFSPEKSVELGKLAVKTGMWVLYEREYGKLALSAQSKAALKKPAPLEAYLAPQGRFEGMDAATLETLKRNLAENLMKLATEEAEK